MDWRLPENRREAFQRSYTFSLAHKSFPGMVYSFLPAIAEAFDLDEDGRAWLVWLNGNTQNAVTSLMLLEAAPRPQDWRKAVEFWNDRFTLLEWDTDRRHQKGKFGVATESWAESVLHGTADGWLSSARHGWESVWTYSKIQPYMGRLSAWSMMEYARILLPRIPDIGSWMLEDKSGSRSHRNGIALVAGYDSVYWDEYVPDMLGIVEDLDDFAEDLLAEARQRNRLQPKWILGTKPKQVPEDYIEKVQEVVGDLSVPNPDVCRLTMESALCTYKSWHKPNRRYPNVYADMMYQRIRKAEARFGRTFDLLWDTRRKDLPDYLRLEDRPYDPGLSAVKQNWYRETGEIPLLCTMFKDMDLSGFDLAVANHKFGERKDPKWTT